MAAKTARVVYISADCQSLAINLGLNDEIQLGMIYEIVRVVDEDIHDPESGESLGKLEMSQGHGEVVSVQANMSVMRSIRRSSIVVPGAMGATVGVARALQSLYPDRSIGGDKHAEVPFSGVEIGDLAKRMNGMRHKSYNAM